MQVFVCYPSEHEHAAREIRGVIRSVGLECWFDKDSLVGGDDWDRERREALKGADVVAVLCSNATLERNGVYQREINEALEHSKDKRVGTRYIIPIRLADVDLPSELQRLQYIDLFADRWRYSLALALRKAVQEKGEAVPAPLDVASAEPDEGGTASRRISEERPNGTIEADWFVYDNHGQYWDFVNGIIHSRILGDLFESRRHIDEWKSHVDWPGKSYWEISLSEHYRKDELVSLTIGSSHYFAGSAHPNHGVETVNLFGS